MIINHNMSAMYANRNLGLTRSEITQDIAQLSTGQRINRAADDASGLAVSERMRAQVRGLNQAERNINSGVSFIQTAEGYLQETQDILHRLRELSVQAANGIFLDEDRMQIQVEVDQLVAEINRVSSHAQFNGMQILTGAFADGGEREMFFQVGANTDQRERVFISDMGAGALSVEQLSLASADEANEAILTLDSALQMVSNQRAELGAYQNRFEAAARGVAVAAENLQASESLIRDADMASAMVTYARNQILAQAGVAMLAQANVQTQSVLQLLG